MRVNLAAQLLSATMAAALKQFGGVDCLAAAEFCKHIDSFFDCMNVSSTSEYIRKRKPNLEPYRTTTDPRFKWLQEKCLGYFLCWKGNSSESDRNKMFVSWQTFEGFQITTYSVVEATQFLFSEGMEFVLTERFCQDPVEEYFGNQRKFGRRSDNPDLKEAGYYDNTIRIQKSISCDSGNT